MSRRTLLAIALCTIALTACSTGTQTPTAAPPTAALLPESPVPTLTAMPTPTETPSPTPTLTPSVTACPPSPTAVSRPSKTMGTPVPSWEGLPVMPGAIEGRPAGLSYAYAVAVPLGKAEAYYQEQMAAQGWQLLNRQAKETSLFGGPAVVLDFARDGKQANITLVFSTQENYTMALLTVTS